MFVSEVFKVPNLFRIGKGFLPTLIFESKPELNQVEMLSSRVGLSPYPQV